MLLETIEPQVNITSCVTCVTEENCPPIFHFFMNLMNKRLKFMFHVSVKILRFWGTTLSKLNVSENGTASRMDLRSVTYEEN